MSVLIGQPNGRKCKDCGGDDFAHFTNDKWVCQDCWRQMIRGLSIHIEHGKFLKQNTTAPANGAGTAQDAAPTGQGGGK